MIQAQPLQLVRKRPSVENSQHDVFAVHARHHGDAKIDFASLYCDFETTILGHAALGNVEFGHHFDARHYLLSGLAAVDTADLREHAIDAVLDDQAISFRFEMDV